MKLDVSDEILDILDYYGEFDEDILYQMFEDAPFLINELYNTILTYIDTDEEGIDIDFLSNRFDALYEMDKHSTEDNIDNMINIIYELKDYINSYQ